MPQRVTLSPPSRSCGASTLAIARSARPRPATPENGVRDPTIRALSWAPVEEGALPESLRFPASPGAATTDPEVQRLRAVVEAKLFGGAVDPVRVGRFVILERIGRGAMGVVYAAYDAELDRKIAIKILEPSADDHALRGRLLREAQAMARLSHPNVVGVFEIGEHQGCGFVAMEFVRGRTLRQWQSEAVRVPGEILERYRQAGQGLAAAHAAGVIHRDLKPENVLIGDDQRVRVVDFGLARTQDTDPSPMRVGTPGYMAPEQILGETTDARSDQFAFCVALWEALAGARPFGGRTANDVFEAVLAGTIRAPARHAMAGWIEAVLRKGLAVRPEDRHATMEDLLRALATDPRRRRRRVMASVIAVAIVPAVLAALHVRGLMRERACETAADGIAEVWNPGVDARVRTAMEQSGAANAATMIDKAIPRLDEYAQGWRSAAVATCRASDIDRTLDTTAAERASACLSERREAFSTLVAALSSADSSIVENSVHSALRLPDTERCTDAQALALEMRPPDDPDARRELRRIEAEIAAADTLRRLGRQREALERLEALRDAADDLEWPSAQALLRFRMAQLHQNLDTSQLARELGEEAFMLAYRAGDDATATVSASLVSHYYGVVAGDPERAEHWDELARAAIDHMRGDASVQEQFRANVQGRRWLVAGDLDQSEAELQRALEIGERIYGPDHFLIGDALLILANVQCRRDEHEKCRDTHERALRIVSAALGDDHPITARALAGLGLAVHRAGDSAKALPLVDKAIAIDERHFGADHVNVATDLSYAAVVLQESGNGVEAVARLQRALPIMRASFPADHPEVELLLGNLGRAQESAGDLVGARASLQAAIAMHDRGVRSEHSMRAANQFSLEQVIRTQREGTSQPR
jgi:tRNA A-37 threonylcarbamoyl transferase component Bud32/tetratricopeptide (TPR) repeat protein